MGEIMTDQSAIWTRASWVSSQVLHKQVWPSHFLKLFLKHMKLIALFSSKFILDLKLLFYILVSALWEWAMSQYPLIKIYTKSYVIHMPKFWFYKMLIGSQHLIHFLSISNGIQLVSLYKETSIQIKIHIKWIKLVRYFKKLFLSWKFVAMCEKMDYIHVIADLRLH